MAMFDGNDLPTESAVVGENKEDPDQLLLLGDNGAYFAYSVSEDVVAPVDPDENWEVEETDNDSLFL